MVYDATKHSGSPKTTSLPTLDNGGRGTGNGTFETEGVEESFYKPIPEYEGIHRYDPEYVWEPEEEKKVVRKVSDFDKFVIKEELRRLHRYSS